MKNKSEIIFIIHILKKYKKYIIINSMLSLLLLGGYIFTPIIEQQIIDEGFLSKNLSYLIILIIILCVLNIFSLFITFLQLKLQASTAAGFRNELKITSLNHALKLKLEHIRKHSLLAILTDANTDINNMSRICSNDVVGIFIEFITVIGYLIGLFLLDWKLTLLILVIVPIKLIISNFTGKMTHKKMDELLIIQKSISRWQSDNYPGIDEIKNNNLYNHIESEFKELSSEREKIDKQLNIVVALDKFFKGASEKIIFVFIYFFAAFQIWNGSLTIGTFFAFIQYSYWLFMPIDVLSGLKLVLGGIVPSTKSYKAFLEMEEEDYSEKNKDISIPSKIHFNNISFGYGKKSILNNFNLTINEWEKTAIVGTNGSGKSTIVNLLMRYYIPESGKITFGNIDINDFALIEYRNQFSIMGQNVFLFNASIKDNISLFNSEAACFYPTELLEYIERFSEKEDKIVGFDGSNLSGGEKQRVALAKCLSKESHILVLDEATSNCDVATESVFKKAIAESTHNYVICITHNFEIIKDFDRIIILDEGKIIADGNFNELQPYLEQMSNLFENSAGRKKLKKSLKN